MNNYSQMPVINIDPPSMDEYDNMKTQSSLNPIFQSFLGMNIEMQSEQIDKNISLLSMTDTLSGNTLLHIAVQSENYPLIELLINKGTCINARNNLEQTPLHLAIHTENHKIINLLLEQKADPNIQDRNGETPMHIAAYNGDYKVIKLLLLFKANMFLRNNNGMFPIDYAKETGHKKCFDVLVKASGDKEGNLNTSGGNSNNSSSNNTNHNMYNKHSYSNNALLTTPYMQYLNNYNAYKDNNQANNNIINKKKRSVHSCYFSPSNFFSEDNSFINNNYNNNLYINNTNNNQNISSISNNIYSNQYNTNLTNNSNNSGLLIDSPNKQKHYLYLQNNHNIYQQNQTFNYGSKPLLSNDSANTSTLTGGYNTNTNNTNKINTKRLYIKKVIGRNFSNDNLTSRSNKTTIASTITNSNTHKPYSRSPCNEMILNTNNINYNIATSRNNHNKLNLNNINNLFDEHEQSFFISNPNTNIIQTVDKQVIMDVNRSLQDTFFIDGMLIRTIKSKVNDININECICGNGSNGCNCSNKKELTKRMSLTNGGRLSIGGNARMSLRKYDNEDINEDKKEFTMDKYTYEEINKIVNGGIISKSIEEEDDEDIIENTDDEDYDDIIETINSQRNNNSNKKTKTIPVLDNHNDQNDTNNNSNNSNDDSLEIVEPSTTHSQYQSTPKSNQLNVLPKPGSYIIKNQITRNDLYAFLNEIHMEKYTNQLINEGFDDIKLILNQMKTGFGLTELNLKEVGIKKAGDRARILIRLQELSNGFKFIIPSNSVYYYNPKDNYTDIGLDLHIRSMYKWLQEIKLEEYIEHFYNQSYHSLELIYIQMHCIYPFTETILEKEIGITKIGYRQRIMNKLKEDSGKYIESLHKVKKVEYNNKTHIKHISCNNCFIF